MAVRSNTGSTLNEPVLEEEEEPWTENGDGSDIQSRLDRHALVNHGKQIAIAQEQLTKVMTEMGGLRKLCVSVRDQAKETNSMLETLGTHLGVQLKTGDLPDDSSGE
jgi:hypothetical protein